MSSSTDILFRPIQVGDLELPNHIIMAAMSRARTDNPDLVPIPLQVEYYSQRASAGLILTEGTWPNAEAIGAIHVPGLFNENQAEGWKRVTDAVHKAGGRIFVQLGHCGAASHPDLLGGALPVAPSAINPHQQVFTPNGFRETVTPRAMTLDDISRTVGDYAHATRLARKAGFDGVELHGTVSHLLPEFLSDAFNHREDRYGGSIENRARFPLEILGAMISEWKPGQIAFKLSPGISRGGFKVTAQTLPTYEHLVSEVSKLDLAFLEFQHPVDDLTGTPVEPLRFGTVHYFRKFYDGLIVANGSLTKKSAEAVLASGDADLVSFAAPFLANPDLVERLERGIPLAQADAETYYQGGTRGYADYPRAT